ncbi:hypothetical protein LVJ94_31980 [Pendulispora rubella]|uniref:Lipoprotein n=1 Tax=Pendulispora rubella TaxID=2741070 RepID=A0ABZ2KWZ0_9BACT
MKLIALSLSAALLAVPASLMLTGCAAETSADDTVATSQDALSLSGIAAEMVGTYEWNAEFSGDATDFYSLTLKKDGTYTAQVEATLVAPGVRCITFPCTLPESGKWLARKVPGGMGIKFTPKKGDVRDTKADFENGVLTLTRAGQTTSLFTAAALQQQQQQPQVQRSACAAVFCQPQTKCVELASGEAACVKPTTSACAAMLCAVGTTCLELQSGEASCLTLKH